MLLKETIPAQEGEALVGVQKRLSSKSLMVDDLRA